MLQLLFLGPLPIIAWSLMPKILWTSLYQMYHQLMSHRKRRTVCKTRWDFYLHLVWQANLFFFLGASAGFRTDTDISGNITIREKTLKRWEPAPDDALETPLESSTNVTGWNQFEANERLFGATSNYDETMYTTRIDRSDPTYKQKEAEAARIAREIEGTEVDNVHMKEERGLATEGAGEDEEAKYSGVRRDEKNFPPLVSGQPNKYTPPARRQAAAQQPAAALSSSTKQPAAPSASAPAQSKEPTPAQSQQGQPAAAAKSAADASQKSVPDKATTAATASKWAGADNATANVETEVLDHFRQFANSEKLKMQERRRNQASYDRNIKLNELMKFSKNFKLATPVPKDLVPILAKDPNKQEKIVSRAQQQTEDEKTNENNTPVSAEQKPAARGPGQARYESGTMPPQSQTDRVNYNCGRQVYPPNGPNAGQGGRFQQQTQPGRPGTSMLSHRLADNLQQRKGAALGPVPMPLPVQDARLPPTGPAGERSAVASPSKSQTPSSTKFNVRAMEFKPNPTASTFTPSGAVGPAPSPQPFIRGRSVSRATSPSVFFGAKKLRPVAERPSLNDQFNPIKRMKKESAEQTDKDYSFNGGIPPAYKTLPTWDVPAGNEEKTYLQMFKPPGTVPSVFPQHRAASNPQMPHQPQMPFPFQQATPGMPPLPGPPHGPHLHPQQHHSGPPHFDDPHRMQLSSSTSQMFPSPRLQHNPVAYPSPMPPHAQLAFQQPMPQFYLNQGAPQPPHMRHYPGAPQFVNPQGAMAAPMMVQQPSGGPYMGVPQGMAPYTPHMQMYSPSPGHAYPHHGPPPQPHSGFPSPSRGAPMMMHQNSQPGQPPQPVMFMAPGQPGQPMYPAQQTGHGSKLSSQPT